jgi:hypothetical protein
MITRKSRERRGDAQERYLLFLIWFWMKGVWAVISDGGWIGPHHDRWHHSSHLMPVVWQCPCYIKDMWWGHSFFVPLCNADQCRQVLIQWRA